MANADSTAGTQVRTIRKSEIDLTDQISALLNKVSGICGILRFSEEVQVDSTDLTNAMWATQDMLDEARVKVEQLHKAYVELERSFESVRKGSPT